jgi:hypothetical protein
VEWTGIIPVARTGAAQPRDRKWANHVLLSVSGPYGRIALSSLAIPQILHSMGRGSKRLGGLVPCQNNAVGADWWTMADGSPMPPQRSLQPWVPFGGYGTGLNSMIEAYSLCSVFAAPLAQSFTAAHGDRLSMTAVGAETEFVPPNVSHASVTATVVGGTGRFAGASGVFTTAPRTIATHSP